MRLRELYETITLFEAYDTKVTKLHKDFAQLRAGFPEKPETQWGPAQPAIPGDSSVPDESQLTALVQFAEEAFRAGANPSEQAMQWYLSLLETYYKRNEPKFAGKFEAMIGQYQFTDFSSLNQELAHFFTSEYANSQHIKDIVKAIKPATTQVDNLITNATAAVEKITTENAAKVKNATPVEILPGDQIILPIGNQGDWWLLPTNKHNAESKFMGHCGTASSNSNVLLSLRDKIPTPWVTIEYNKDTGVLHQSKGRSNSKPAKKFHYALLALLKSDLVNGIYTGKTYQPSSDFSLFDMDEPLVLDIAQSKPQLITDQIKKYPIDFLRAPQDIRANPEFRTYAIQQLAGLSVLVDEAGTINQSSEVWEEAINTSSIMIIYAPETLINWERRITAYLKQNPSDVGYASTRTRSNYNIMSEVIKVRPYAVEMIPVRAPKYKELAHQAIKLVPKLIKSVTTTGWSTDELKQAWTPAAKDFIGTDDWPENLFTPAETKELWRNEIIRSIGNLNHPGLPANLFSNDEIKDMWSAAIESDPFQATHDSFDETTIFSEEEKNKIRLRALEQKPAAIVHMPDFITDPKQKLALWMAAIKVRPELIDNNKFPISLLGPKDEKDMWIARSKSRHSKVDFNNIPDGLFTENELKDIWMSHLTNNSTNLFNGHIKPPSFLSEDKIKELYIKHVFSDPWSLIGSNTLPEIMNTPRDELSLWSAAIGILGGDFTSEMREKWWDEYEDAGGTDHLYAICSANFPWHLFDDNAKQQIKQIMVENMDTDEAENSHCLGKANYRELEKLFTPEELFELHAAAVTTGNAAEQGGVLVGIPRYHRTFELCKLAIEHDPETMSAVPKELMTEEQYNYLLERAQYNGGWDETFLDTVNNMDEDDRNNPNRSDPALQQ
jgi:hypothetical protein